MGAPLLFACEFQTSSSDLISMIHVLRHYRFKAMQGNIKVVREPIGVAGLITPIEMTARPDNHEGCPCARCGVHNGPEVFRDRSFGCRHLVGVMHSAGLPKGVYNMVHGEGAVMGDCPIIRAFT